MCKHILLKTPLHLHVNVRHCGGGRGLNVWKNSLKSLTVDLPICFLLLWSSQVQFLQRKQLGKLFMVMAALPSTNRWGYNSACGGKRKHCCESLLELYQCDFNVCQHHNGFKCLCISAHRDRLCHIFRTVHSQPNL